MNSLLCSKNPIKWSFAPERENIMAEKKKTDNGKAKARTKKVQTGNIFSEGVLVTLRTRLWGATGKLESSMYEILDPTLDKKEVYASMSLLKDTSLIDAMRQVRDQAKRKIKVNSIYFPDANFDFIPKHRIEKVAEELDKLEGQFFELGEDLVNKLEELKEEFKASHPEIFETITYPSKAKLLNTFEFKYVLRVFSAPDKELGVISPSIYKQEMRKWKEDINSMKEETAKVVCKEIADRIEALKEGCETGKISQTTINSINGVLEKFDTLWNGFVDEKDVKKMIKDVKLYIDGTDADMLRYDDNFRGMVANKAAKIAGQLEEKGFKVSDRSLDI